MRTTLVIGLCLAALTVVSAQQAPPPLEVQRAREGQNLTRQAIRSRDGFFAASVLGQVEHPDVGGGAGVYSLEVGIGSDIKATCEIIRNGFQLASGLRAAAGQTLQNLQSLYGRIRTRAVDRIDAGAFGPNPYVALEWSFVMYNGKEERFGSLKQIGARVGPHGFYCAHLDVGYSKSFLAMAGELARSMTFTDKVPGPFFTEVSTARLNGEAVGVAAIAMERIAAGRTLMSSWTSLVHRDVVNGLGDMAAEETLHDEVIGADGSLVASTHVARRNDDVDANVGLELAGPGQWRLRGLLGGKELDQRLDAPRAPSSFIAKARARQALFTQKSTAGAQLQSIEWLVNDPTHFVDTQLRITSAPAADRLEGRETAGGRETELVIDRATGLPVRQVTEGRSGPLEWMRTFVSGTF